MHRVYKALAIVFVLAALVVVVVVVAIRFLPESALIRNEVQEKLRALTGQEIVLGSLKVSATFPSLLHLSFEGISVNSPQGKKILSADKVILSPELMPLLRGQLFVESITVQGLRASFDEIGGARTRETQVSSPHLTKQKSSARAGEDVEKPAVKAESAGPDEGTEGKTVGSFRWSVHKLKLVDARIDWVNRHIVSGREVIVSLDGIDGSVTRQDAENSFAVNLGALISVDKANSGAIKISGIVTTTGDMSRLAAAQLELSASSLDLKPFHTLVPSSMPLFREFGSAVISVRLSWEQGRSPTITCKADLRAPEIGPAQLSLQGDLVAAEDFGSLEEISGTVEAGFLPLSFLKGQLPAQVPLEPSEGVIKGNIQGEWKAGQDWKLRGDIGLENAVPSGKIKDIGKPLRLWGNIKLDPDQLLLENVQVFGPTRIASVAGKVTKPFSDKPGIDLKGEVAIEPRWFKGFGVQLPKALEISGAIPVRGLARGQGDQLWLDLTGDLTGTEVRWDPYFRKGPGKKGTLSLKGKFSPSHDNKVRQPKPEALLRLGIAGASLRLTPQAPWISGAAVQLDSKVLSDGSTLDFKDATLAVRRGSEAGDLLAARASIGGLGSTSPRIDANGTVTLDKGLLALAGLDMPQGVLISGSAPVKVSLNGFPSSLDWGAEIPLTHLDITVQRAFRKPGGVNGSMGASGKFIGDELLLTNGRLTLPGLAVTANGMLRDARGKFRGITLNVKKSELREILRLVPAAAGMGLSGPVEAAIGIKPVGDGVVPAGTVRLFGVDYRPEKAGWALEKMKGTIELDGTSVETPEVSGNVTGALEGPAKIKGAVNGVNSVETLNGRVSAYIGQGRIKADRLRGLLTQTRLLIGTLVNPQSSERANDPLEFQSLAGDFQITAGKARTDNLSLKGPDLGCGAIGSVNLASMELDTLVGIRTVTVVGDALGKIPAVKKFVKKHEGLLAATGLDKELKRIGIDVSDTKEGKSGGSDAVKTPVTMILKLKGPVSSPHVAPVMENTIEKGTLSKLKSLLN